MCLALMTEMVTPNVGLFFLPSTLAVGLELMGQFCFGGDWEGWGKIHGSEAMECSMIVCSQISCFTRAGRKETV